VKAILRRARGDGDARRRRNKKPIVRGRLTLDPEPPRLHLGRQDRALTVTEFLILQALAQRPAM
jgi:two-component system response regulator ChvI